LFEGEEQEAELKDEYAELMEKNMKLN